MWSNHPENREVVDHTEQADEDTLVTPRFDEEAIRQAKPAVPLSELVAHRVSPKLLLAAVLVAGLLGSIIGSVLSVRYFSHPGESKSSVSEAQKAAEAQNTLQTNDEKVPPKSANANLPASVLKHEETSAQSKKGEDQEPEKSDSPSQEAINEGSEDQVRATDREPDEQNLNRAFHTWLQANKEGDVDRQMGFYNSEINAFYRKRKVSPEAVRAEKSRVLGRANTIQIEAGEPDVKISPDGQQATIRYRKRYRIEGEEGNREGEVLQELRWKRVNSKWRIVSERDVKVLNKE
jgi:hypothetical protein